MLIVFVIFNALPALLWFGYVELTDFEPLPRQAAEAGNAEPDARHPLSRLLADGDGPWVFFLGVSVAIIVAPLAEEFLYRIVLQGWIEAVETRCRRQWRWLRCLSRGSIAVTTSSLLFAGMHIRIAAPARRVEVLVQQFAAVGVGELLALAICIWLLRQRGATMADLGIVPKEALGDIGRGLFTLVAVAPIVIFVQVLLLAVLPEHIVPDPIPLVILALALGFLCYRTRRVAPAIVLHMAFNSVAVFGSLL